MKKIERELREEFYKISVYPNGGTISLEKMADYWIDKIKEIRKKKIKEVRDLEYLIKKHKIEKGFIGKKLKQYKAKAI